MTDYTEKMNSHAAAIAVLNLPTKESLEIAMDIIAMVRMRGDITLNTALGLKDQSKIQPTDYVIMTNLVTVTEEVLRILSANIENGLDEFDEIFPLKKLQRDDEARKVEDFRKVLLETEEEHYS